MTPAELELLRKVFREETGKREAPKANGKVKLYLEIGGAVLALLIAGGAITSYLFMPRAEAGEQHQAIRNSVTNERQTNLLQEQHLITLDGSLTEIKEDIRAIGNKVGAKMGKK